MESQLRTALEGGAAGLAATLPMSAAMYAAKRAGLMGEYPPEIIARKSLGRAGVVADEETRHALATLAHLGFGAAAGALFGFIHRLLPQQLPSVATGIGYGLLVYAASYNGWIPAVGFMPEPERDRPGRQPSMILAHVIYGMTLGAMLGTTRGGRD